MSEDQQDSLAAPVVAVRTITSNKYRNSGKMTQFKYTCEYAKAGCNERFKTKTVMRIHTCDYSFNYDLTEEKWGSR